jgi:Fe2+ or Zn2+ uptake regulation protein
MSEKDIEYFRQRASVERALANAATESKAAAIHNELAERYERRSLEAALR